MSSPALSNSADKLVGSPMFNVLARAQEMERQGKKVYHFEIGDPDFETPEHITQAAIDSLKRGETHYADPLGIMELRRAIQSETKQALRYEPGLGQIAVAPTKALLYFLVRLLTNPGDEAIVASPTYPVNFSIFSLESVKEVQVPLSEQLNFDLDPATLVERITDKTKLVILTTPNNPTGTSLSLNTLKVIYEVAEARNLFVLSDETYYKMVFDGNHHSISEFDQAKRRTMIVNSFSKAYAMTGWRLGWVVAPELIIEKIRLFTETVLSGVPRFVQQAGLVALKGDQSFLIRSLDEYRQRRDVMVAALNTMPGVHCVTPTGAIYAFPNISRTGMTSEEFATFALEQAGVALLPGKYFGAYGEGYVRLVYATNIADIRAGLKRLHEALLSR